MLFLLLSFSFCTLKNDANPYKILDVPKNADHQQIKSAYRKLTMKYHPDITKDESTTAKWIEVNDAYEILNDPDRKALYDMYGIVNEKSSPDIKRSHDSSFEDVSEAHFQKQYYQNIKTNTPSLTKLNFDEFVEGDVECLILIYTSFGDELSLIYLGIFEQFAERYGKYCKCARIDCALSAALAKEIGVNVMPTVLYYKKENETVTKDILPSHIYSSRNVSSFLASHWNIRLFQLESIEDLEVFLDSFDKIKIIEVGRRDSVPTLQFQRFCSKFNDKASFGYIESQAFPAEDRHNFKKLPCYLIYRSKFLYPIAFNSIGELTNGIKKYSEPVMIELTRPNFPKVCIETENHCCFARVGQPSDYIFPDLIYSKFGSFWISEDSKAVQKLGAQENQWIYFDFNHNQYAIIDTTGNETSTLQKLYNTSIPNMKDLPSNFKMDFVLSRFISDIILIIIRFIRLYSLGLIDKLLTFGLIFYFAYKKIKDFLENRRKERQKQKYSSHSKTSYNKSIVQEKIKRIKSKDSLNKTEEEELSDAPDKQK